MRRDGDSSTDINAVCGVMERIFSSPAGFTNTEEIPIYIEGGGILAIVPGPSLPTLGP